MRNLLHARVGRWRVRSADVILAYGSAGDATCGMFRFPSPSPPGGLLKVVASADAGWDHVSVSLPDRCPTWQEMEHVKRLFFFDHETAMQLHVPTSDHIDCHPNCLHLWRPHAPVEIPRPPGWMVGPKKKETAA